MDPNPEAESDAPWQHVPPGDQAACNAEYRRQLLLLNRERIEFSYESARARGVDAPVILVLDLNDDRAAGLSRAIGIPWDRIIQLREECRLLDVVPVHVMAVPPSSALCLVGPTGPRSSQGIAKPCPVGAFRVVAVAAGGNAFADFPLPPGSPAETPPW